MFDYINPISYYTDVNNIVFAYNTGAACGLHTNPLDPYANFFDGSIFSPQNALYGVNPVNIFKDNPFANSFQNINFGNNLYNNNNIFSSTPVTSNPMTSFSGNFNIFKIGNTPIETPNTDKTTPSNKTDKTNKSEKSNKPAQTKPTETKHHVTKGEFRNALLINAEKYLGYNEADGSSKKISPSGEWCADFIAFIIEETSRQKGIRPPKSLVELPYGEPNRRVEDIKQWGIRHGKFIETVNKSNKAEYISKNIKPGDILILRENGASHTGFVTKVYKNGYFDTIEGNREDKVTRFRYSPYYSDISGFVRVP